MSIIEAILLGLLQGITEFLPISSDGHLELGKAILGISQGLPFTMVVHMATTCSIIVVFWKDIAQLLVGTFGPLFRGRPEWNAETRFSLLILVSMLPVMAAYFLLGDKIESLFSEDVLLVGVCLLANSVILLLTIFARPREKSLNIFTAVLIGIGQAVAMLPGVSRSGSTISTGLWLGIDKEKLMRFSFLMVLLPIIGGTFLMARKHQGEFLTQESIVPYASGFVAAFISGVGACKLMLNIVRKGKIAWFALYCAIIGLVAVIYSIV